MPHLIDFFYLLNIIIWTFHELKNYIPLSHLPTQLESSQYDL